jgi:hypothetical protein
MVYLFLLIKRRSDRRNNTFPLHESSFVSTYLSGSSSVEAKIGVSADTICAMISPFKMPRTRRD